MIQARDVPASVSSISSSTVSPAMSVFSWLRQDSSVGKGFSSTSRGYRSGEPATFMTQCKEWHKLASEWLRQDSSVGKGFSSTSKGYRSGEPATFMTQGKE
eukprot:420760-Pelagomonas_calceolata.AAC.3